ncbi:unnamed protein product, partial [Ectocarpus sp. 12 AP-2014]
PQPDGRARFVSGLHGLWERSTTYVAAPFCGRRRRWQHRGGSKSGGSYACRSGWRGWRWVFSRRGWTAWWRAGCT